MLLYAIGARMVCLKESSDGRIVFAGFLLDGMVDARKKGVYM